MSGILRRGKRALTLAVPWAAACLAAVLPLAPGLAHAYPATQCAADRYGGDLNCTANDIGVTGMRVIGDTTSCVGGTDIILDLEMTVNFGNPTRYDLGVFISNDGKSPQLMSTNGGAASCSVSALPAASPFLDLDSDSCGDGNKDVGGGTGRGVHYMANVSVPCQSLAGAGGELYIPFVLTYAQNVGDVCNSSLDLVSATKSACNAPTITQGTVSVLVLPAISKTDGKDTLFSGDATTYTVTITNTTGVPLAGAVFKDPAVAGIGVSDVSCTAAGGGICPAPAGVTVAAMQGAGIAIPEMPVGGSVTFTIPATLTGAPTDILTNTAYVTVGSQTNTASDDNVIVDAIFIDPPTQAKTGDNGAVITYTYTLHNYGITPDTIDLSVSSSQGWTVTRSPAQVTLAAAASTTVTVTVTIPGGAAVGMLDTTTLTGFSSATGKTATATAVTTVTEILTLAPSNSGAGGAGTYVYYSHRVQNNANTARGVSLTPSFTAGVCTGWTSALYETDKATPLTSPFTLVASGGYRDFMLRVQIPLGTTAGATCTATLTAAYTSGAANAVSVTDVTTVKNLLLYEDPAYTIEQSTYPAGNTAYGKTYGLTDGESYYYRWLDPVGAILRTSPVINNLVAFPDTYEIPTAGPLGAWTVQVCNDATTASCTVFAQTKFYVGPDHLEAAYSGSDPTTGANLLIDLALHDRFNHVVPFDASGNLVGGDPADLEGPLMITVTVSGSAEIVDDPLQTTLGNYVISGQTITGRLDATTGTAQIVIRSSFSGTVTVTPASYKGVLYGSPARDHSVTLSLAIGGPDHYEIVHDGSALTCVPEEIMVVACSDDACTAQLAAPVTVTLAPSGWVGGDSVTFTGSTSVRLRHVAPGTVTLAMADQTPPAANGYRCVESIGGSSVACEVVYYDSGFDFAVPAQTSCKTSGDIVVSAIGRDPETNQCVPLFADSTHNLSFWSTYLDPNTGAVALRVNGSSVVGASPGTSLALGFDSNGQAIIQVSYGDAGQISLHARYLGTGAEDGLEMLGNDAFVVAPAGLCVYADGAGSACGSGDADCTAFVAAGAPFDLKVKGVCWEIDGEADSDFCDNPTTPNFQLTNIVVSHSLVAPGGGNPGVVTVAGFDMAAVDSGEHTIDNQTVSEVGVFTFTADPPDYLGAGDLIPTSTSANIGRFYPDHFQVTIAPDPPTLIDSCLAGSFTYLDEPFGFTVEPVLTVTAVNRGGVITGNYDCEGFWKLPEPFTLNYTYSDGTGAGPVLAPAASSAGPAAGATTDCNGSVSMTITDNFTYSRPPLTAPVPPFGADIDLSVAQAQFTDSDNVCYDTGSGCQAFARNGIIGASLRFGQAVAANGYAPETVTELDPLLMLTTVQYYDDPDGWVINTDDDCSQYDYTITPNGSITIAASPVSPVTLTGGTGILELWPTADPAPPGGTVVLDYDFPAWLEPDLPVEAFFGIYRGNDRIINWREIVR